MSDNHWAQKNSNPGPISPEGKAISSKNARKHGCCTVDATLLPTESPEDFKALERTWCQAYTPAAEPERHLVAELVNADWLLQRATQSYLEVEVGLYTSTPNPSDWTEAQERKLSRFLRYKTAHANAVIKARKAIEDYRKSRLNQKLMESRLENLQNRARKQAEANKPKPIQSEPTWKEHLQNMRDKAISLGFTPPPEPPNPTKR